MYRGKYMKQTKAAKEFTKLILETFRLNGALIAAGDKLIADLGLTSARWQVLGSLQDERMTVSDIAREMGLSRQNVQLIADKLVVDGFVETASNPAHRRAKHYFLSSHGKSVMLEVSQRQVEWSNRLSANINSEDISSATQVLSTMSATLIKDNKEKS